MTPLLENLAVLACVALAVWIAVAFLRSERWVRPRARLLRDRVGLVSLAVIVLYCVAGLSNLVVLPIRGDDGRPLTLLDFAFRKVPSEQSYSAPLAATNEKGQPLAGRHLLGTDVLGKDVLLQTMKGASTALLIGGLTSLIYIPIGVLLGIASGYYKRRVDDIVQYLYSTIACIPNILLLISILVVLGKGVPQMAFALGLTGWVGMCRLLRGETLRQSERTYCEAARALGLHSGRIVVRHILPNVMHLVLINFVLGFSGIVLAESILSYIGVGMPIGTASWGSMIDSARMELVREPKVWWNLGAASAALFIFVLNLNLFGDALRKAFDPKAA
jgi:peptide/nickel transport system permease protein